MLSWWKFFVLEANRVVVDHSKHCPAVQARDDWATCVRYRLWLDPWYRTVEDRCKPSEYHRQNRWQRGRAFPPVFARSGLSFQDAWAMSNRSPTELTDTWLDGRCRGFSGRQWSPNPLEREIGGQNDWVRWKEFVCRPIQVGHGVLFQLRATLASGHHMKEDVLVFPTRKIDTFHQSESRI